MRAVCAEAIIVFAVDDTEDDADLSDLDFESICSIHRALILACLVMSALGYHSSVRLLRP